MLVLSRKMNETIIIADDIRVTVVGIRGNQVRLGIEAPAQIAICREELRLPVRAAREGTESLSASGRPRQSVPLGQPPGDDPH